MLSLIEKECVGFNFNVIFQHENSEEKIVMSCCKSVYVTTVTTENRKELTGDETI